MWLSTIKFCHGQQLQVCWFWIRKMRNRGLDALQIFAEIGEIRLGQRWLQQARETAQWLRALPALPECMSSVPRIYTVLLLQVWGIQCSLLSSMGYQAWMWCTYKYVVKTLMHIKTWNKSLKKWLGVTGCQSIYLSDLHLDAEVTITLNKCVIYQFYEFMSGDQLQGSCFSWRPSSARSWWQYLLNCFTFSSCSR